MAANTNILIKRSTANGTPGVLKSGELAWSYASDTLFIGDSAGTGYINIGTRQENLITANGYGSQNQTIDGQLTISGNLIVQGVATYIDTVNLIAEEPIIFLANNNTVGDAVDIGFAGQYNNGAANVYTGLIRHAGDADKRYHLFNEYTGNPQDGSFNIVTANAQYASLQVHDLILANGTSITDSAGSANVYIKFLQYGATGNIAYYNPTSGEVTYGPAAAVTGSSNGSYSWYVCGTNGDWVDSVNGAHLRSGIDSVGFGFSLDETNANTGRVAIGYSAASAGQFQDAVAIGTYAGQCNQQTEAVAIGNQSGQTCQGQYSVAIGGEAGQCNQCYSAVAIGEWAGKYHQGQNSVAIGRYAGQDCQCYATVAIGYNAGQTNQCYASVAIGYSAGQVCQCSCSVAIGSSAGQNCQSSYSVAIGSYAGQYRQCCDSVAIGSEAGQYEQKCCSVAVGSNAGQFTQQCCSVALGRRAGQYGQGSQSVAVGSYAGNGDQTCCYSFNFTNNNNQAQLNYAPAISYFNTALQNYCSTGSRIYIYNANCNLNRNTYITGKVNCCGLYTMSSNWFGCSGSYYVCVATGGQAENAVAIGYQSGNQYQGTNSVAIGYCAASDRQHRYSIAIGTNAGKTVQYANSVSIGTCSATTCQSWDSVAIGKQSGKINQSSYAIAIGRDAGYCNQGYHSIALGYQAGKCGQGDYSVAIGHCAGQNCQCCNSVAIGSYAGQTNQGCKATAVGSCAGTICQQYFASACGYHAGYCNQQANAVAVGHAAGQYCQGGCSVSIGFAAGRYCQGSGSVAIGRRAGRGDNCCCTYLGANAIAIGNRASEYEGVAGSIVLNSSGNTLNAPDAGFYVSATRYEAAQEAIDGIAFYNPTTKEMRYSYSLDGGSF